jgi:hypothetical protein
MVPVVFSFADHTRPECVPEALRWQCMSSGLFMCVVKVRQTIVQSLA